MLLSNPPSQTRRRSKNLQNRKRAAKTVVFDTNVDDQAFDNHLRSFFPSETISVSQPEWTIPVHPAEETFYSAPDNAHPQASSMRFNFNGKYIPPTILQTLPTYLGLHHHALDPRAAGYTVSELLILAHSTQPFQKCIALKIIGFLLADVAGVMNDSSDSPEEADSPEPMPTQREARSASGADADPGRNMLAQREASPRDRCWSSIDRIFTQRVDFL